MLLKELVHQDNRYDTDGPFGSNCVGDAFVDTLDPVIDSYGHLQGYLSLAHSPNNCQAAWGSFRSNSNTWKVISVCTILPFSHAAKTCRGSYFIANAYIDARMLGLEQGNGDCVYATIDLTDNKGIIKHVQSHKSFCL